MAAWARAYCACVAAKGTVTIGVSVTHSMRTSTWSAGSSAARTRVSALMKAPTGSLPRRGWSSRSETPAVSTARDMSVRSERPSWSSENRARSTSRW